ncbi:hypothetical protein V494_06552 [Pseudogymnoascus sp. VKM F-4513 (FW-928)]|nr:hypothetical protein V494_06552 [Pseudogymnoascus sp. VKM F-4513 (FW-928)]
MPPTYEESYQAVYKACKDYIRYYDPEGRDLQFVLRAIYRERGAARSRRRLRRRGRRDGGRGGGVDGERDEELAKVEEGSCSGRGRCGEDDGLCKGYGEIVGQDGGLGEDDGGELEAAGETAVGKGQGGGQEKK